MKENQYTIIIQTLFLLIKTSTKEIKITQTFTAYSKL